MASYTTRDGRQGEQLIVTKAEAKAKRRIVRAGSGCSQLTLARLPIYPSLHARGFLATT